MKNIILVIALLALSVSAFAQTSYQCERWETRTVWDYRGFSHNETVCTRYTTVRHYHYSSPDRTNDLLTGVVLGAVTYHVIRDRRSNHYYYGHHRHRVTDPVYHRSYHRHSCYRDRYSGRLICRR